jgi:hypothetical protein
MMIRLDPPLPLVHEDGRKMMAHLVIDYGVDFDLVWVCIMDDTREVWCWPNPKVRGRKNETMGRV